MLIDSEDLIKNEYENELNFQHILCDEINEDDLFNYGF